MVGWIIATRTWSKGREETIWRIWYRCLTTPRVKGWQLIVERQGDKQRHSRCPSWVSWTCTTRNAKGAPLPPQMKNCLHQLEIFLLSFLSQSES